MDYKYFILRILLLGFFFSGSSQLHASSIFVSSKNTLEVSCAKLYSASGVFSEAYSVNLLLTNNAGNEVLRLVEPINIVANPPEDCEDSFRINSDGISGDFIATKVMLDTDPSVSYSLHARASLPAKPNYDFAIISLIQNPTVVATASSYSLYLAMAASSDERCDFSVAEGCTLVLLDVEKTAEGNFVPVKESMQMPYAGLGMIQPAISPNRRQLAFMASKSTQIPTLGKNTQVGKLYVLNLDTDELNSVTQGNTYDGKGQWPTWITDTELMFSYAENCDEVGSDEVACDDDRTFADIYLADISDPAHIRTELTYGETDGFEGNWEACAFEDPFYQDGLFAFHSQSSVDPLTYGCPFTIHVPDEKRGLSYGPQPGVISYLDKTVYDFNLASAGINACAHFAADDGLLICTEQNTFEKPYRECSIPGLTLGACTGQGGHIILYNRLFGWRSTGGVYQSVNGTEPLFTHVHPSALPGAENYWDPSTETCAVYKTKQAQVQGDTILAHIYCQSNGDDGRSDSHVTVFSRTYLIDITTPASPKYFDLTGWLEENFDNWEIGKATGFTGVLLKN